MKTFSYNTLLLCVLLILNTKTAFGQNINGFITTVGKDAPAFYVFKDDVSSFEFNSTDGNRFYNIVKRGGNAISVAYNREAGSVPPRQTVIIMEGKRTHSIVIDFDETYDINKDNQLLYDYSDLKLLKKKISNQESGADTKESDDLLAKENAEKAEAARQAKAEAAAQREATAAQEAKDQAQAKKAQQEAIAKAKAEEQKLAAQRKQAEQQAAQEAKKQAEQEARDQKQRELAAKQLAQEEKALKAQQAKEAALAKAQQEKEAALLANEAAAKKEATSKLEANQKAAAEAAAEQERLRKADLAKQKQEAALKAQQAADAERERQLAARQAAQEEKRLAEEKQKAEALAQKQALAELKRQEQAAAAAKLQALQEEQQRLAEEQKYSMAGLWNRYGVKGINLYDLPPGQHELNNGDFYLIEDTVRNYNESQRLLSKFQQPTYNLKSNTVNGVNFTVEDIQLTNGNIYYTILIDNNSAEDFLRGITGLYWYLVDGTPYKWVNCSYYTYIESTNIVRPNQSQRIVFVTRLVDVRPEDHLLLVMQDRRPKSEKLSAEIPGAIYNAALKKTDLTPPTPNQNNDDEPKTKKRKRR